MDRGEACGDLAPAGPGEMRSEIFTRPTAQLVDPPESAPEWLPDTEQLRRPVPPGQPIEAAARHLDIPAGAWSLPTGERFDPHWVHFNEAAG